MLAAVIMMSRVISMVSFSTIAAAWWLQSGDALNTKNTINPVVDMAKNKRPKKKK